MENANLFNTLSTVISSQIQLTNILSDKYYNRAIIDDKLSGLTEIDQNIDEFDVALQNLSAKLDALSGNNQDMSFITSGEINACYDKLNSLESSFDF